MTARRGTLLVTLVLSLAPAVPCRAAPADVAGADSQRARARELVKSGDLDYRLFKFQQALESYLEAYRLTRHPAILFNVAQAYRQLKDAERASFHYKMFLTDWRKRFPAKPPPFEGEVKAHIERLDRLIQQEARARREGARAVPRPTTRPARLELEGLLPGARVTVDGVARSVGPTIPLTPGRHRVRVEAEGYQSWERWLELQEAEQRTVRVELEVSDYRTLWLVLSLSTAATAAGFLGAGLYYNVLHNDLILQTPEADESKRLAVMYYAIAGGAAALSAAGFTVYLLHRRQVLRLQEQGRAAQAPRGGGVPSAAICPLAGGAMATGTFRF